MPFARELVAQRVASSLAKVAVMKWISLVLAVTVLLALIALVSPAAGGILLPPPAPTATARAAATPTALAAATLVASVTPSPTATVAVPTPAPRPTVPPDVAEKTVRDFFTAVGAKDYARLQDTTTGQGRQVADGIIAEVSRNEQEKGVALQPRVSRLDVLGVSIRAGATAVRVAYTVQILARVGPFLVPSRELAGEATFVVADVGGRPLITNVEGDLAY